MAADFMERKLHGVRFLPVKNHMVWVICGDDEMASLESFSYFMFGRAQLEGERCGYLTSRYMSTFVPHLALHESIYAPYAYP